jgi:hypothetical protein
VVKFGDSIRRIEAAQFKTRLLFPFLCRRALEHTSRAVQRDVLTMGHVDGEPPNKDWNSDLVLAMRVEGLAGGDSMEGQERPSSLVPPGA